jgi:hypothetical protein
MRIADLIKNESSHNLRRGAVALAVILLTSFLVLEVAVVGLLIAYFSSERGTSQQISAQTYAAARSGVADALMRLERNPLFTAPSSSPYTIMVDDVVVTVSVVDTSGTQVISISSVGQKLSRKTSLIAIATADTLSGAVLLKSINQVSAN